MQTSSVAVFAAALLAAALLTAALGPAAAAPQILGLVATAEPVPLTCEAGTCTAELTTVCLQEHRDSPKPGTAYRPSALTRVSLSVGGVSVDVTARASFKALRNISSVAFSLPEAAVRRLGAGQATISVGPLAAVIPVAEPGDAAPQTGGEIAAATGPSRAVAGRVFEDDGARLAALGLLNQVINRLPGDGPEGTARFEDVWKSVVGKRVQPLPAETRRLASEVAEDCRLEMVRGLLPGIKSCVAYHHDALASETTKKVWRALKPNG